MHREAPLTDVHAHPSLKVFLFRRNLWRHYCSGKSFNPFASRTDFKVMIRGGVRVTWVAHYLPERQIFRDCFFLKLPGLFLPRLTRGSLMTRLLQMMDSMERQINKRPEKTELATGYHPLKHALKQRKMAFVHTIEGAHVLEGNPENLAVLARKGVAMITLCHFYRNCLAAQVNAVPKDYFINKVCNFRFQTGGTPLTEFGRQVLRKMKELKILVDIAHCTPQARQAIYAELNRSMPIIASHVGVQALNPDPYNLSDEEIQEIHATGGALGIIFMTYWLHRDNPKNGLDVIWKTMEHVHRVTGSWDSIVLGTDFDGFTDPPDDLQDYSQMGRITQMLIEKGLSDREIKNILGGNALRLLRRVWKA